ncbi:Protein-cysteine N-palmitoyltransferase Rasp [Dufourea novaeangliae]|uniref:Protein-cysteine N-palmitoyltransferase Rasp n=1 Tax=Dufourea novaeangliae TaxID=178035 RepID=A0A154PCI9_DUFNO|nr:Protein-cysteine N-palmitoyltransferase Rasp [Dufourea novaeangliae]
MTTVKSKAINLPKYESLFYFFSWTGAVFYSIYKVSLLDTYFNDYHDLYDDFSSGWIWIGRKQDISDQEWKIWIPLIINFIPWIFLNHFISHIIKLLLNPMVFEVLNPWALYGLGYCMGQFFLIKYVVVYGLNHTLCAIDNIQAPSQPKCVARIYLYSDMWKYFDKGLYKFLVRYIYIPLLKSNFNKVLASFLCFTFVFVWHGMQINIFIWAFLNFIGLNIESLMKLVGKNMWYSTFVLLLFLYCCCQVSTDLKNWNS